VTDEDDEPDAAALRTRLRFLRIRERVANVENREAITRERRRLEERLEALSESSQPS
jgi:hypothetical protein